MPKLKIPIALIYSTLLCSCSKNTSEVNPGPIATQNPANVVKVLNRVTCENMICTQENINKMWQICLDTGWIEKSTTSRVISSRSISELVSAPVSYSEIVNETKDVTDPSGVVSEVPTQRSISKETTYTGYCIGSEYITQ